MAQSFQKKLAEIQTRLPQALKRFPSIAKVEGLRFIADNFKHQGFEEKTGQYKKWQKKKGRKKGDSTISPKKPTLIGEKRGGAMRRSWQGTSSDTQAEFTSQLPYTEVHNDGLRAGRPPGFDMPQRQMIGDSEALNARIEKKLDETAQNIFM